MKYERCLLQRLGLELNGVLSSKDLPFSSFVGHGFRYPLPMGQKACMTRRGVKDVNASGPHTVQYPIKSISHH